MHQYIVKRSKVWDPSLGLLSVNGITLTAFQRLVDILLESLLNEIAFEKHCCPK